MATSDLRTWGGEGRKVQKTEMRPIREGAEIWACGEGGNGRE